LQKEYNKLCELSLKIINKNKFLKNKKKFLENEVYELKEKAKRLEKSKTIDTVCTSCQEFKLEIEKLKIKQDDLIKQTPKFKRFDKSISCADEIMKLQKSPFDQTGLGFTKLETLSSLTKQGEKAQEIIPTATVIHRSDGTKNLVPSVDQKGSTGYCSRTEIFFIGSY
jgi:tellurite resistance protein